MGESHPFAEMRSVNSATAADGGIKKEIDEQRNKLHWVRKKKVNMDKYGYVNYRMFIIGIYKLNDINIIIDR